MTQEETLRKLMTELLKNTSSLQLSDVDISLIKQLKNNRLPEDNMDLKEALSPMIDPKSTLGTAISAALQPQHETKNSAPETTVIITPSVEVNPNELQLPENSVDDNIAFKGNDREQFCARANAQLVEAYPNLMPTPPVAPTQSSPTANHRPSAPTPFNKKPKPPYL